MCQDKGNGRHSPCYDDIFAGVLVGGHGRRLGGQDKARLPAPPGPRGPTGQTLLERTVELLRPLVADVVLAGRVGQAYPETACRWVQDEPAGIGPLGGLNALLRQPPRPWLLLVACDLPRLAPELLALLAAERHAGARVVVPVSAAGMEPACALYHAAVREAVQGAIARRQHALRSLVEAVPHVTVAVPTSLQQCLTNLNTPADVVRLSH